MAGQGRHQATGSATSDLRTAITTAGLAVGLVDLSDCTIASISEPWLSHLGRTADSVIGQPAVDLIRDDKDAATQVLTSMRDGAITAYVARREFDAPPGVEPMGTVWVRSFHIGERHYAFVQAAPGSEDSVSPVARQLGRDPIKMAIGTINPDFTITAMSRDITGVLGVAPEDLVGKVLLNVVARRDVAALLAASDGLAHQAVALRIHLQNQDDEWVQVCCILTSLAGNPDCCFILVPDADEDPSGSRVTELEHHLWTIAAIVEASGVLQGVGPMRDMTAVPQANNLTTRQWEILARLVRGERVPAIAAELYLSQSTVRNHLSAIFKRFGVHSQSELLKVLDTQQDADARPIDVPDRGDEASRKTDEVPSGIRRGGGEPRRRGEREPRGGHRRPVDHTGRGDRRRQHPRSTSTPPARSPSDRNDRGCWAAGCSTSSTPTTGTESTSSSARSSAAGPSSGTTRYRLRANPAR